MLKGINKCIVLYTWVFYVTVKIYVAKRNVLRKLSLCCRKLRTLFGEASSIDDTIRDIIALPVKFAGIGLPNPVTTSTMNFESSILQCSHFIQAVKGLSEFCVADHQSVCCTAWNKYVTCREDKIETTLTSLLSDLPLTGGKAYNPMQNQKGTWDRSFAIHHPISSKWKFSGKSGVSRRYSYVIRDGSYQPTREIQRLRRQIHFLNMQTHANTKISSLVYTMRSNVNSTLSLVWLFAKVQYVLNLLSKRAPMQALNRTATAKMWKFLLKIVVISLSEVSGRSSKMVLLMFVSLIPTLLLTEIVNLTRCFNRKKGRKRRSI